MPTSISLLIAYPKELIRAGLRSYDGTTFGPEGYATVVSIPEPSTYAMALAGLGFTGYSLFRRRKRA